MAEVLTIGVSREITETGDLLPTIDYLKRLFLLYDYQPDPRYVNVRAREDNPTSIIESINPKRRKKRVPFFFLMYLVSIRHSINNIRQHIIKIITFYLGWNNFP